MRNENGQFIKETTGNPLGRPKKADEQYLVDLWTEHGQQVFSEAVIDKQQWAVKLLMDKLYANKKESGAEIDLTGSTQTIINVVSYASTEESVNQKELLID
ncbi:MAG: hypothetical protein ACI9UJ_001683 [bacterium]|jgi:hypothetical protein